MNTGHIKHWTAAAFLLTAMAIPASGQQRPSRNFDQLADQLELTDAQAAELKSTIGETDGRPDLWVFASALQSTLTADQKAKLLDRGRMAGAFARGMRAGSRRAGAGLRAGNARAGRAGARAGRAGNARAGRAGARAGRAGARAGRAGARQDSNRQAHSPSQILDDLTDAQKERLETARTQHQEKLRALRQAVQNGEIEAAEMRTQSQALRESMKESMSTILTGDQQEKLRASGRMQQQSGSRRGMGNYGQGRDGMRQNRQGSRGNRGFGMGGAMTGMGDALNLSDSQKETVAIHRALTVGMAMRMATRSQAGGRGNRPDRRTPR
jgi:hypothetical protein